MFCVNELHRPGDIAAVVDQNKREGKRKSNNDATIAEGVIYKSTEKSITIAIESNKSGGDDLDLPERLAVIKLANLSTFERMHKNLEKFKSLLFSQSMFYIFGTFFVTYSFIKMINFRLSL